MSSVFDSLSEAFQGEIAERINEALFAHYREATVPGVVLEDVQMINAANHRITGTVDDVEFCCDSGDMSGFVMIAWGDEPMPIEVPTDPIVLGPQSPPKTVHMAKAMHEFFQRDDVIKAERSRAYDTMFAPGVVTQLHYDAVAKRLGCVWMTKSERKQMLSEVTQ